MIIAYIYIHFDGTSKNAKKSLALLFLPKKCHEVSKNAKFAFFGTKNAKLATMLLAGSAFLVANSMWGKEKPSTATVAAI